MQIARSGSEPTVPPLSEPGPGRPRRSFATALQARADDGGPPAVIAPTAPLAAAPTRSGAPVRTMLEGIATAENRIDAIVQAAARGKTFSPGELLALQATVFRYAQTVEVVSRVADRLVGAVKQTMGGAGRGEATCVMTPP